MSTKGILAKVSKTNDMKYVSLICLRPNSPRNSRTVEMGQAVNHVQPSSHHPTF